MRTLAGIVFTLLLAPSASGSSVDLRGAIEHAAAEAARAKVSAPDRLRVEQVRVLSIERGVDRLGRLVPLAVDGPNAGGQFRIQFRVDADGHPLGTVRALVQGQVLGPAVVVQEAVRSKQEIPESALKVVKNMDLTRLRGAPFRSIEALSGQIPSRTLSAGTVMTRDVMEAMPIVHRGDPVSVLIRKGRLLVRALGTATRDGAVGEVVPVRNQSSGTQLMARVQEDGTLLVVHGGMR